MQPTTTSHEASPMTGANPAVVRAVRTYIVVEQLLNPGSLTAADLFSSLPGAIRTRRRRQ